MSMSERPKAYAWKAVTTGVLVVAFVVVWPLSLLWRGARFIAVRGSRAAAQAIARTDRTLDADSIEVGLWLWAIFALPPISGLLLVAPAKPGSWLMAVCGLLAMPMFCAMVSEDAKVLWARPAFGVSLGAAAVLLALAAASKSQAAWILLGLVATCLCVQLAMRRGARRAMSEGLQASDSRDQPE